jgi:hypothetical protein
MASTYTTNSGIEKPGSGEQSGTWGATVNTNMDIIDTLVSGFISITAGSTSVTLTTTDGSVTAGMNRAIKYVDGGDLGGNCTVTIAPNDQEKLIFVENGLSASRSLIFTQGAGANFTLQNGKQALIRSDGAGSGAVVYGVLANLEITTLEVTGAAAIDGALTAGGGVAVTGNVTATGTVEPAGDTAAADNAAIGYTSAEGLILTGQGSTNDITIKNDADSDVITIATGATNVDVVGDLTASTLNADGDTSAGDNATIGYTSAEGLIITGQGSTNDVTIKNDADADVITIATGATNVDVVGDLTAATLNADGDTSASDSAAIGYTSGEGIIITGQGSTSDITLKNDADGTVFTVPTGTDDILFPDSAMAMWGAGSDMLLYHDGTNSYITNAVGALKIATETSGIAITIGHATSETTVADNLVVTGTAAAGGNLLSQVGKQTIWVPAASMYPSSTNGCSDLTQVETTALRPDLKCLDFDASSDEFAQFAVAYPKSWNGGTVSYQPFWTVTGTNTGTVAWQVGGIAVSNDDSINTVFGTLVATTALAFSGTSNDLMVSAESGAVTIAGTPAANDLCFFQINRDISADDQSGDARLLGIKVFFTTNAANDT